MLTRYRELYNCLTHSESFKSTGVMNKDKVNKQTFTPHNLKSIILGAKGYIAYYYTTNSTTPRLIQAKVFSKGYKTPLEYKDSFNEQKGMIDALVDGYKFNYLEEIIFFTGDFTQEELSKEEQRINSFRGKEAPAFKRLRGIYIVEGSLSQISGGTRNSNGNVIQQPLFNTLNSAQPIAEQLLSKGITVSCLYKNTNLKVNELGLLERPGLDSSKYVMDSEYTPDLPTSEKGKDKYRLSKYFYDEVVKAEADKKARDAALKEKVETAKQVETEHKERELRSYVRELMQQGFKVINNTDVFFGKSNMGNKLLEWLKNSCTERPNANTGFKYKAIQAVSDFLKEKGVRNTKDASIFSADIFTKSVDLEFRMFVKETEYGVELLIKLPNGLTEFFFNQQANAYLSFLFSNTNPEKGKIFQCSVMDAPAIKSLSATHGVNCPYKAIEVTLAKDLIGFAKSKWLFLDYLRACNGEVNAFSNFKELPLGDKIAVGVKTNSLKVERFDCSGQYQTSGIICGQAGSGKSALMDSLVVQFLALKGDYGNGSVVLMDAKQEWPPLWAAVFREKGIPFYGFDGSAISNQDRVQKKEISPSGKVKIANFNESITMEVGGMLLMRAVWQVIQGILKQAGCKDIQSFNKSNKNIDGITRLPRIAIFIDEMNTFASYAQKGTVAQKVMPLIVNGANLTRTTGFMWFLCGQDVPRSIVGSDKRGSFKYNIMGTMDKDRYEYFGVTENPNVVEYEESSSTPDNPHPIMKQGTFYAGMTGKTELIRSMFIPDEEKSEALDLINSSFEGMHELDAIVHYALRHRLFDDFTDGVNAKNNIIFATLRDLGVISEGDFEEATMRVLGNGDNDSEQVEEKDFWNEGFDAETTSQPRNSQGQNSQSQPKPHQPQSTPFSKTNPEIKGQTSQQPRVQQHQTQQNRPRQQEMPKSAKSVYNGHITVSESPFSLYSTDTTTGSMLTIREFTKIMMDDIRRNVCPDEMVRSFEISNNSIVINDIGYRPTFDASFLNTMPYALRVKAESGELAEFFDLRQVYKYKYMEQFKIQDEYIAQGRARKEMGIGFRKRWSCLFDKLDNLMYIKMGSVEYTRKNPDLEQERGILERFQNDPKSTYAPSSKATLVDKIWDSKPARTITKAAGWTLGVQALWTIATLCGPWGILFGAFAVAGVYSEHQKSKNSGNSATSNNSNTTTTNKKKNKK